MPPCARTLLDVYALVRLSPRMNLRINLQNLLGADTDRQEAALRNPDAWLLDNASQGVGGLLVSLEGKW